MTSTRHLVVFLISITVISIELLWTRLFSAEYFYTFAFLILSLAILGLGIGALLLRLFNGCNNEKNIGWYLSLSGLFTLLGPVLTYAINIEFSQLIQSWPALGKLILIILFLSLPFVFAGMALALIFKTNSKEIPRLYMFDMIGAGCGAIFAIICMNLFQTPAAAFIIAIPILLASVISGTIAQKGLALAMVLAAALGGVFSDSLIVSNKADRAPVIYKNWDAMSLVKIFEYGDYRGINIDNAANSPILPFDGEWNKPDSEKYDFGMHVQYLIERFDSCVFLSLGSGAGGDVLQALQYGATEVHAVEVNGHINDMMLYGDSAGYFQPVDTAGDSASLGADSSVFEITILPEYTGNLYHDPRVTVATDDARAYARRFDNKFDIIYSLSSNSFAALASGSFALAENYLFTVEAFEDYWNALTDSGFLVMEHQFYMPRILSETIEALQNQGVDDYKNHIAIYHLVDMRRKVLLLSKAELTDEIISNALKQTYSRIERLYPLADSTTNDTYSNIVENGWQSVATEAPNDISPCYDNRPFVAQQGLWRNFKFEKPERLLPYEFYGYPLSGIIISIILIIVIILFIPLNLIPYFKKGEKLALSAWLYFFMIGMAFMMVEVTLIQKYTFFVGPSVYSIAVILLTLLIGSGIGSRFSSKFSNIAVFGGIILWLVLDITIFNQLIYGITGLGMTSRMLITSALLFPLAFFMGMPFPKGALSVGRLIDWGFSVNGAASVIGSVLILLISFSYGFSIALITGAFCYALAYLLIMKKKSG